MTIFTGPNGDTSSKRVSAFLLIVSGIVFAFLNPTESVMAGVLIGSGTGILGVAAITKT